MYHELALLIRFVVIAVCVLAGYWAIRTGNSFLRLVVTVIYGCALIYYVFASRMLTAAVYYWQHPAQMAARLRGFERPGLLEVGAEKSLCQLKLWRPLRLFDECSALRALGLHYSILVQVAA